MSVIALEGMKFHAHHGYYKEEQKIKGEYLVDLYVDVDIHTASSSDELDDTVNYERLYKIVSRIMTVRSSLLEHLAQSIMKKVAEAFPSIRFIKVRVSKLNPPLPGSVARTFVELENAC